MDDNERMRKAIQEAYQPVAGIRVVETEGLKAGAGEVLVEVGATGVNPVDWKLAEGFLRGAIDVPLPYTPGCDVAGIVREVGAGVGEWKVGDAVFGYPSLLRGGGYAEFAILLPHEIAAVPSGISLKEAAGYPVAAITAYEGLFVYGTLEAGMRLLVLGGAGGVGSAAVQLGKEQGAEVYATGSARNQEYLASMGAKAIDYGAGNVAEKVSDVDFVFDAVGGASGVEALATLKRGGQFVTPVYPMPSEELLAERGVSAKTYGILPSRERLEAIRPYIERGALRIPVAAEYGLGAVAEALAASKGGHTRGKLLVVPGLG